MRGVNEGDPPTPQKPWTPAADHSSVSHREHRPSKAPTFATISESGRQEHSRKRYRNYTQNKYIDEQITLNAV